MKVQMPVLGAMGWIEVICGSMFSGKTEELIRRINREKIARQKVQVFKPKLDNRFSNDHVVSHSSLAFNAINIENPEEILGLVEDNTRVVGIDEAQFLAPSVVEIAHRLANRGLRVIVAGLDMDYRGVPFGPMPQLMATAEFVTKMSAICTVCGNTASRTQRRSLEDKKKESGQILVGAGEFYEARCRRCYEPNT